MALNIDLSIIPLNVNGLNAPIKRHWVGCQKRQKEKSKWTNKHTTRLWGAGPRCQAETESSNVPCWLKPTRWFPLPFPHSQGHMKALSRLRKLIPEACGLQVLAVMLPPFFYPESDRHKHGNCVLLAIYHQGLVTHSESSQGIQN